jgi:hypothetical protein
MVGINPVELCKSNVGNETHCSHLVHRKLLLESPGRYLVGILMLLCDH